MLVFNQNISVSGVGKVVGSYIKGDKILAFKQTKSRSKNNWWMDVGSEIVNVELTKGYWATVSFEKWKWLQYFKWYAMVSESMNGICYAATSVTMLDGTRKIVTMHSMIANGPDGKKGAVVDHYNGDSLCNLDSNLRITTRSNNALNSKLSKASKTGHKNVTLQGKKYRVSIRVAGKLYLWDGFTTLDSAVEFKSKVVPILLGTYFKNKGVK